MNDVYIGYSREETSRAEQLARALEGSGFSVWWDRQIPAGTTWAVEIERRLREARCVVVMWSTNSIASDWVQEEAAYAREEGKLIPVLVDKVEPPFGFRQYQTLGLTDWGGETSDAKFQRLIQMISEKVGK